jgi:hypothetical protein
VTEDLEGGEAVGRFSGNDVIFELFFGRENGQSIKGAQIEFDA